MDKNSVLILSLKKLARDNAELIAAAETEKLRRNALDAGWPSDVVNQIDIVAHDESLKVSYPDIVSSAVLNLEYGTTDAPPSPVIRSALLGAN